jgi:hypothetical protein
VGVMFRSSWAAGLFQEGRLFTSCLALRVCILEAFL